MSRHVTQHKGIVHRVEYLQSLWPQNKKKKSKLVSCDTCIESPAPSRLCLAQQQSSLFSFVVPFVILHWNVKRRMSVFSTDLWHHIKSCALAERGSLCVDVFVPNAPLSAAVTIPQPVRPQMSAGVFYGHT